MLWERGVYTVAACGDMGICLVYEEMIGMDSDVIRSPRSIEKTRVDYDPMHDSLNDIASFGNGRQYKRFLHFCKDATR